VLILAGCLPQPEKSQFDPGDDWDGDSFSEDQGDCDDADPARHPDADEVCNDIDDDCNDSVDDDPSDLQVFFEDLDGDGWGGAEILACAAPPGSVDRGGDCGDGSADIYPGAPEICSDDVDEDCDQVVPGCALIGDLFANDTEARIPGMFAEFVGNVAADGLAGLGHGDLVGEVARVTVFGDSVETWEIDGSPEGLGPRRTRATAAGDATGDGNADVLAVYWSAFNEFGGSDVFLVPGPIDAGTSVTGKVRFTLADGGALGTGTAAGDVDGDGRDDLLLGAPGWGGTAGAVFLIRGPEIPASGTATLDLDTVDERIAGRAQGDDGLGYDLALSDADGDGLADLIVATCGFDLYDGSEVYLISGPDVGTGFADTNAMFDWSMHTIANTEDDGPAVTGLGDVDGDGGDDLAFSAPPDGAGHGAAAWVMARVAELDATGDPDLDAHARIIGDPEQSFGGDLAGIGDLDGDNYPELAIGCERCIQDGAIDAGGAFVMSGAALATGGTLDAFAGDGVLARVRSQAQYEYRGSSVAGLGDVDGDGWPDLAVGSGIEAPIAPETWVLLGGPER
jgi:hypothetical protein